jgi:hypothetical protein
VPTEEEVEEEEEEEEEQEEEEEEGKWKVLIKFDIKIFKKN